MFEIYRHLKYFIPLPNLLLTPFGCIQSGPDISAKIIDLPFYYPCLCLLHLATLVSFLVDI